MTVPKPGPAERTLTLAGNVEAWNQAPIYAQVSGYVTHWYKDYGAHMESGELLADVDAPGLDAQYRAKTITAEQYRQSAQTYKSSEDIMQQQLTIPPAIILHMFCIMAQAEGSEQVHVIFIPPAHFSIFIMQRGTMTVFIPLMPVGIAIPMPVGELAVGVVAIGLIVAVTIVFPYYESVLVGKIKVELDPCD